jgi:hypothetical protein
MHPNKAKNLTVNAFMEALIKNDSLVWDLQVGIQKRSSRASDPSNLLPSRITLGRSVDANDFTPFAFGDSSHN